MNERIVIITGANSGIGKAAAVKFAAAGYHVIMACRDLARSQKARQEIMEASRSRSVELMRLDVSCFESIREFCSAFRARYEKLDILIHNAGYFNHGVKTYQFSADGLELTFATNVFGPHLMTELLLDLLARSADPRVLFAASTNLKNFFDPKRAIEFDNLRGEFSGKRRYTVYKMYGDSKMAVLLLTCRMATEYAHLGIKVNAVMIPATRIEKQTMKKFSSYYRLIGPIIQNLNPWALEPAQMADTYHHVCTSAEFREISGALVNSKNQVLPPVEGKVPLSPREVAREVWNTRHTPPYSNDPDTIETMWRLSREVIAPALAAREAGVAAEV